SSICAAWAWPSSARSCCCLCCGLCRAAPEQTSNAEYLPLPAGEGRGEGKQLHPFPLLLAAEAHDLLAARVQMGLTLAFHIVLAVLGVGMPVLMLIAEWRFLRTRDELWRTLAQRWSKAFAVLFAVGAVSGTVLSFELGLLWPAFMGRFG